MIIKPKLRRDNILQRYWYKSYLVKNPKITEEEIKAYIEMKNRKDIQEDWEEYKKELKVIPELLPAEEAEFKKQKLRELNKKEWAAAKIELETLQEIEERKTSADRRLRQVREREKEKKEEKEEKEKDLKDKEIEEKTGKKIEGMSKRERSILREMATDSHKLIKEITEGEQTWKKLEDKYLKIEEEYKKKDELIKKSLQRRIQDVKKELEQVKAGKIKMRDVLDKDALQIMQDRKERDIIESKIRIQKALQQPEKAERIRQQTKEKDKRRLKKEQEKRKKSPGGLELPHITEETRAKAEAELEKEKSEES